MSSRCTSVHAMFEYEEMKITCKENKEREIDVKCQFLLYIIILYILDGPILFQEHNDFFHMVDMYITAKISESQKKASFYFDKKGSINSKNNTPPSYSSTLSPMPICKTFKHKVLTYNLKIIVEWMQLNRERHFSAECSHSKNNTPKCSPPPFCSRLVKRPR